MTSTQINSIEFLLLILKLLNAYSGTFLYYSNKNTIPILQEEVADDHHTVQFSFFASEHNLSLTYQSPLALFLNHPSNDFLRSKT